MRTVKAIIFLLTLGFIGGIQAGAERRARKLRQLHDDLEHKIDETLDESFPASDAPSWTTKGLQKPF